MALHEGLRPPLLLSPRLQQDPELPEDPQVSDRPGARMLRDRADTVQSEMTCFKTRKNKVCVILQFCY